MQRRKFSREFKLDALLHHSDQGSQYASEQFKFADSCRLVGSYPNCR
jgi:transposase InsO family protein